MFASAFRDKAPGNMEYITHWKVGAIGSGNF